MVALDFFRSWVGFLRLLLLEQNGECESRAHADFRLTPYSPTKLLDKTLRNVKPQAYSVRVELLRLFQEPEKLKELLLIIITDPDTCVRN